MLSCKFEGLTSDEAGRLLAERGVAVRTGLHCAPAAHKMLGSFPEGLIRFSVSCFTDEKDFEVLQQALDDLAEELL
jgi:selenocysteine lyase/cysteine desulfurase